MGIPRAIRAEHPELDECILLGYRGSIAHGTYMPQEDEFGTDDKDVMGVYVPGIEHYYGLRQYGSRGTREIMVGEWDIVIYEMRKMLSLLAKGNPNVLQLLWLERNHYLHVKDAGQLLIDNRDMFRAKQVYRSFVGYAHGQLHRMTHHAHMGYMGEKRKELVVRFGYDTKNAAHLIRLLRMGIEFLVEGKLHVKRHDSQQLLEIKRGEWSLDRVKAEADRLFSSAEEAYIKTWLPNSVDMDAVNDLCVRIVRLVHGDYGASVGSLLEADLAARRRAGQEEEARLLAGAFRTLKGLAPGVLEAQTERSLSQ